MYNQLASLYLHEDVLCRKFEHFDGTKAYLQEFIPTSLVPEIFTSLHNSATAGNLGTYKTIEKIRQRYYWPEFKEDVKKHIRCCDCCQKRAGPQRRHRHSLTDLLVSYPFHHIGLNFLGPLRISNNCQYVLLIGDHFTKRYAAIPRPDQRAETAADVLLNHWICRFGCPHSIHTDQGHNLESDLFQQLMRRLEINKTRTTSFHPQSNAVIERMNRTLLNMLSKCLEQNPSDWSTLLPFVLMAYRSSVHESIGFTSNFLVFGHEMSLPLDLMYKPPEHTEPSSLNKQMLERQEASHKAFELVRRNTTAQQLRRSALYNRKVHRPVYKEGDCVLLHYPDTPLGCSPRLSSHWRGPYRIIKCLNDINYKIEETSNGKELVVHYDRLKRYHGVVAPTSLIPECNPISKNVPTSKRSKRFDHSYCEYMTFPTTSLLPSALPKSFYRPQPIATPIPASPRCPLLPEFPPTPSAPLSSHDSFNASTLPACSSSSSGKTLLSGVTPRESSTPISGRRGLQSGELPPSTPPGPSGNQASYFHSTSPSSPISTLNSVIAGASRDLPHHPQENCAPLPWHSAKRSHSARPDCPQTLPHFSPLETPKTAIEPNTSNPL